MSANNNNVSNNPGNFANRPTEEVKAIASMGGKAAHAAKEEESHPPGRNADGTFMKGSEAAKEAGHVGGLHAAGKKDESELEQTNNGRNEDGTFKKGSEVAKEAGHIGGLHAAGKKDESEMEQANSGRNEDGTFQKGSEAAKEAGHKGGLAAAGN